MISLSNSPLFLLVLTLIFHLIMYADVPDDNESPSYTHLYKDPDADLVIDFDNGHSLKVHSYLLKAHRSVSLLSDTLILVYSSETCLLTMPGNSVLANSEFISTAKWIIFTG
jgi:hypothetical protein